MLDAVPLLALVAIAAASLIRGEVLRRSGDRAWAFSEARGTQRVGGLAFILGIVLSAAAAAHAAIYGGDGLPSLGALIAIAGAAIVIVAQVQMGRAWRVGVREGDAPLFVRHGLFRFSRNPIFVGMMLIGLGVAVTSAIWWSWLALAVFVAACAVQVSLEERHLAASFGSDYLMYRERVPRWLGIGR